MQEEKGLECRFHFPKPPSQATVVSRVPVQENSKQIVQQARTVIHQVMNTLREMGTDHTLHDILTQSGITTLDYNDALKISTKKTTVIMKRSPSDTCINPYTQ